MGLILAGVAAGVSYLFFDRAIVLRVFENPLTWLDHPWAFALRQVGKADVPIWLLLVWSCLTNRWRPTLVTCVALILVGASVSPLKVITARERPHLPDLVPPSSALLQTKAGQAPDPKKVSFPSGDAAVIFSVATVLSFFAGRLPTAAFFTVACFIGWSRVGVCAHYPSDVLAGAIVGVLCGAGAMRLLARWPQLDQLRVDRLWRIGAGLLILFVMPFATAYFRVDCVLLFLRIYWPPVALAIAAFLAVSAWRARGSSTRALVVEGPESQPGSLREPGPQPDRNRL